MGRADNLWLRRLALGVLLAWPIGALAQDEAADDGTEPTADESVVPSSGHMEFDERLIKGERAAGSVYLFQRRPRRLPGLVPMRVSYRSRIVEPVLGERAEPPEPLAITEPVEVVEPEEKPE